MINLRKALRLEQPATIALVGAGGKTTAMFQLARQFSTALVTTSTHLGAWQAESANTHIIWQADAALTGFSVPETGICLVSGPLDPSSHRYGSLNAAQLAQLHQIAKANGLPLLIEADGSRQKPLKAPAEHEPAVPGFVDVVVVVAGLSGLDQPLNEETVQRAERFAALSGLEMGDNISTAKLAKVLNHAEGGLKNIPARARRITLLNQAETSERQATAGGMVDELLKHYDSVLVASLGQEKIYAVFEPVMAVILAAGAASRYGQPKQLLNYHGQPFVRRVAQTALAAGLSPVRVVTGANAEAVEAAVADLDVEIVRNAKWQEGQSSSIRAGLGPHPASPSAVHPPPNSIEVRRIWGRAGEGAVVFILADQPQVTQHVLAALKARHAEGLFPIVAPLIADRRGNPVLFDRDTFPDLLKLTGDVGGRALFREYPVEYIPWHDDGLLLDVDDENDYRKLLAWGVDE